MLLTVNNAILVRELTLLWLYRAVVDQIHRRETHLQTFCDNDVTELGNMVMKNKEMRKCFRRK